jgi:hypothetical protein
MAFKKLKVKVGQVTGTHTNFPTLIQPSLITGLGSITLAEAQSARFYSDVGKTTEIAREIVSADEIHVKVTSMEALAEIWMDYDGIRSDYAVTATYGRNNVWSDYAGVFHQDSEVDSSGNGDATAVSITNNSTNGKIGDGAGYNGSGSRLDVGTNRQTPDGYTLSSWVKTSATSNQMLFSSAFGSGSSNFMWYLFYYNASGTMRLQGLAVDGSTNDYLTSGGGSISFSTFTHVAVTHNLVNQKIYLNGALRDTGSTVSFSGINNIARKTYIGAYSVNNGFVLNGSMDESRICTLPRSADCLETEYNNQNANGSFWEATDAGGGAAAQAARRGVIMMM